MAIYECRACGMSVKTVCGKCNEPLVDGILKTDDGNEVTITSCFTDACATADKLEETVDIE